MLPGCASSPQSAPSPTTTTTTTTTTTPTPTPASLSDLNSQLAALNANTPCARLMQGGVENCAQATEAKIALAAEIDPLLKNMPTSANVTNALTQTSEIYSASQEWNDRGCHQGSVDVFKCNIPAFTVEAYFSGLTKLVGDITR